MARGLIAVDFEEEWRTKGSEFFLGDFSDRIAKARELILASRRAGTEVIYTQHVEPGSTTAFAPGGPGIGIFDELKPAGGERVFEKHRISPFYKTGLEEYLSQRGIVDLTVCGIMTNLCVRSLIADAYDRNMAITVATDACVSDSAETDRFTFDDIRKTRPEVTVATTAEILRSMRTNVSGG